NTPCTPQKHPPASTATSEASATGGSSSAGGRACGTSVANTAGPNAAPNTTVRPAASKANVARKDRRAGTLVRKLIFFPSARPRHPSRHCPSMNRPQRRSRSGGAVSRRCERQNLIPAARHAAGRIGDAAVGSLERGDARHLGVTQFETEHVEIIGDAFRLGRKRDDRDVLLDQPAQRDLRQA